MLPENIDDLFREKLDGHASPPGDDLWARLQAHVPAEAAAAPEPAPQRLDQLFQKSLNQHATPPRRELWERLEDEHLRPRKRRAAAWWPMAMAAAVALLLLVGGAGWWLGFPNDKISSGSVASQSSQTGGPATPVANPAASKSTAEEIGAASAARQQTEVASAASAARQESVSAPVQKNVAAQATRPEALASTASKASKAAREQSSRYLQGTTRQPDAATGPGPQVARSSARPAPRLAPPSGADEPRKALEPAPVIAQVPTPNPAAEIVPATAAQLITVDVRSGSAEARPAQNATSALASAEEPAERRGLGGRLLQQAGHLIRGERLSLAEATGLPETVTLRATIAGRRVSKSIQL